MEVQQIYNENKNNLLFSKNSKIKKLREKILKKITKDYLNKKNNESIKNVDLNLLNSLDYKYKKIKVTKMWFITWSIEKKLDKQNR